MDNKERQMRTASLVPNRGRQGELVKVAFQGDFIDAIWWNGKILVSVRRVCQALGIDPKNQQEKLQNAQWATGVLITLDDANGAARKTYCIEIDCLPMWLATIDAGRVAQEVRPKLLAYQREATEALRRYFFGGENTNFRLPVYTERISRAFLMSPSIPEDHWTVFDKCNHLLILVEIDLKIPVEKFDLLDGSVGIRWSQHRKGKMWERDSKTYVHSFPDRRGEQNAKAYHLDELAEFDKWLRNIYIPRYLPDYLDGKYSLPVPARTMIARVMSGKVIVG